MEVSTVMAPTATSPPNRASEEVKLMDRMLSVDTMTKLDTPSPRHGPMMEGTSYMFAGRSLRIAFLPRRKLRIQQALTA